MGIWDAVKRTFGVVGPSADAPPRSPQDIFTEFVEVVAHTFDEVRSVERVEDEFAVKLEVDEEISTFFLGNLFHDTREMSPQDKEARVRRAIRAFVDRPASDEARRSAAESRLVTVLRGATFFGQLAVPVVSRPCLPYLLEAVAIDCDDAISYLTKADCSAHIDGG